MSKNEQHNKYIKVFNIYNDVAISLLITIILLTLNNSQNSLKIIGFLLILISFYLIYKVRFYSSLLILFGLIAYVNLSVAIGDLLQVSQVLGSESLNWQMGLRSSDYNIIASKALLFVMIILNIMINKEYLNKIKTASTNTIIKKDNFYIFFAGMLVLLVFWFFGYSSSMGDTYHSNTRTIYEYSILIFLVVWFYSGKSNIRLLLLYFFAIMYILQALVRGDRSSAFPMILALVLINDFKINLRTLIILAISGILASNIVSAYRIAFSLSDLKDIFFDKYGMTAFLSDTVSQSYYTGITIVKSHYLVNSTESYFFDFLGGIFLGGGFRNADVGAVSFEYLLNKGGGFYFSWFYFWFGIVGVIVGAIVLGYIIRSLFSSQNNYIKLYRICLIVMTFRWYLYTPFVLYRSVIFILSVLLIISIIVDTLTTKKLKHG
ncbi:hypothetical protein M662_16555 [Bacillus sp. SB49]|uniref:hypothetical protein n=1 Tax=Bacillus sp. SB49 TaxID=1071080 RepID=UPI00138ACA82|nr:hypothetical protein [Bacillus sp. SB49]QHT48022.1 hypothetical protein M662_16555 [Bacillus sp. SB49]